MTDVTPIRPKLAPDHKQQELVYVDFLIPTHDMVSARFMYDYARLVAFTVAHMPPHVVLGQHMVQGTYVHSARQDLLEAVKGRSDWIVWFDTDHSFPQDAVIRLMSHDQDVVGINYATRNQEEPSYVAIKSIFPPERLETKHTSRGVEEVEAMGMGLVLIKGGSLVNLPPVEEIGPWFQQKWDPEHGQWIGEDVYFMSLLREKLGLRLFVDHELSLLSSHIGPFEYRCTAVEGFLAAGEEEDGEDH
jgi:hypothetical protein